ncbi:MAG: hypothetical protein BJ554DRAFT_5769, partial [Olpidium bornovanus]
EKEGSVAQVAEENDEHEVEAIWGSTFSKVKSNTSSSGLNGWGRSARHRQGGPSGSLGAVLAPGPVYDLWSGRGRFSAGLINSLEKRQKLASSAPAPGAAEAAEPGKPAATPPAEAVNAEIERRVAELVAAERARLEEREKALARFEEELVDSALAAATPASPAAPTPGDGRSVSIVAQDVEELEMRRNTTKGKAGIVATAGMHLCRDTFGLMPSIRKMHLRWNAGTPANGRVAHDAFVARERPGGS